MKKIKAIKIKKIDAKIKDIDYEIIPDKILIKGNIHKHVFYVGADNRVRFF